MKKRHSFLFIGAAIGLAGGYAVSVLRSGFDIVETTVVGLLVLIYGLLGVVFFKCR